MNYAAMLSVGSDSEPERKKKNTTKPRVQSERSKNRIAAQQEIESRG